jgi:hypothetical protein
MITWELVTVWTDYMIAVNWMYKNTNNGGEKWIAKENGRNGQRNTIALKMNRTECDRFIFDVFEFLPNGNGKYYIFN